MNCKPCGKSFTGLVPFTQHVESAKHKRKVSSLNILGLPNQVECAVCHSCFDSVQNYLNHPCKNQNKILSSLNPTTASSNTNDVSTDGTDQGSVPDAENVTCTECKTCDKKFSGLVPYVAHLASAGHTRKVEYESMNLGTESTENDASKFFCDLCKKMCTGPEPYNQHLASVAHKKKAEMGNDLEATKTEIFSCELCKKIFTGPEPYNQHLAGAAHKKKAEMGNDLGAAKTETFSCEPCKKIFPGKINYEQHLVSKGHKKKLKLLESCGQAKESDDIGPDSECDSPPDVPNKKWFCKFCRIQCSGLIPYKQHLEGDLHSKNARVAPKRKSIPKAKKDFIASADASKKENLSAVETQNPVKNEECEGIEVDLSQVTESLMPPDDFNFCDFFSDKREVDTSENKTEESSKKNGSYGNSESTLDDKEIKIETHAEFKSSKEDDLSHKSSKRPYEDHHKNSSKKDDKVSKKLRSS